MFAAAASGAGTGASGDVAAAAGPVRGLVPEATFLAGCDFWAVGWDEVSRAKSSRMLRAASHPVKSNRPTPMPCLTRLLIVIPPT